MAVGEQDVLGLHIAMHESLAVREVESRADLLRDPQRILQRQLAGLFQTVA